MKFSCDDCGAQYMIADDKIGPRGVKVRCKKCAHVIVLRTGPDGVPVQGTATIPPPTAGSGASAPASAGSTSGSYPKANVSSIPQAAPSPVPVAEALKPRKTAQPPPPPDGEEDEATVALDTRGRGPSLLGELPLGVSSDLGLSQEFAARGFDPAPPPAEPKSELRSPFSGVSMGGSLRDLASEERTPTPPPLAIPQASPLSLGAVGLGAAVPDDDGAGEVNTSVDHLPSVAAATPRVLSRGSDDDESSAEGDLSGRRADSVVPAPGEFDEIATRVAKPAPEDLERSLDVALPTPMAAGRRDEATVTHGRSLGDDDDAQDGGLAADLNRSLGEDDLPLPMAARAGGSGSGRPRAGGLDGLQAAGGNLDEEIGSAFEAVFGANSGRLEDPFAALGGPNGAHEPGEDDRKATRVFDTDAMRKLQDEQDLAVGLDLGDSAPPPAPSVTVEPTRDWYVAVNDEQVGPLSIAEVQSRWSKGDVDASSLCWKQGMADWIAIRFVRELGSVLMSSDATSARVTKADLADEPPTRAHVVAARAKESSAIVPPSSQPIIAQVRPGSVAAAAQAAQAQAQESTLDMRRKSTLVDVPGSPPESTEPSEPSWRPSAASALASLAQAELETSSAKLAAARDVAVGPALPAKGAYEPLSAASMFGAGEQTSTRAGGLPKSADLGSSVSLRDPAPARPKGGISVPVAVLGGAVILAVAVVAAVLLTRSDPPPPVAVAPVSTPAATPVAPPSATPAATAALAPTPAPDPAVTPPPGAPAGALAAAPTEGTAPGATPAALPAGAIASAAPVAAAAARPLVAGAGAREPRASRSPKPTKDREPAVREAPAPKEPDALEVAAAPRKSPERVEADDLLAEGDRAGSKPAPRAAAAAAEPAAEDVPDQLEETDILRVLRKYKADINACKEKQAKDDPGLEGVMTVNLVVLKTGRTSQPTVAPDKFKSSAVGKCVVNSVKGWKFPPFSGRPMPIDFPVPVRGRG